MKTGVVFPQTEIGTDPVAVRDFAQTAEELGFRHLLAFDHVLGVDPKNHDGWEGYTNRSQFHEPFTLFAHLAAVTHTIEFGTAVMVLPQRQTALVAKQAAEVDLLSGGRLRLGVGVGYNDEEFGGLGEDFSTRGERCEEQIAVLRSLWTQEAITFEGRWHRLPGLGISPLPAQQPIPLWVGGMSDAVLDRVGRLADGWFPMVKSPERLRTRLERVREAARHAGRRPEEIGVDVIVWPHVDDERVWRAEFARWVESGMATHLTFATLETGFDRPQQHLDAITRFRTIANELGV